MDFQLDVSFTDEQLSTLYATGTNLIIGRPSAQGIPNVAWQVIKPLQANTITWQEEYGIFSSTTKLENGADLNQLSSTPIGAEIEKLYTLLPSAEILGPATGGFPERYSLLNQYESLEYLTAGLYQDATINGTKVFGNANYAVPVIYTHTAAMPAANIIYIWLQAYVKSNSVVTVITSPLTELDYSGGMNTCSVKYDSATGKFISDGPQAVKAGRIRHIEPLL